MTLKLAAVLDPHTPLVDSQSAPATALAPVLRRARRGCPEACGELHERFRRVVRGIALAHVGASDADDLCQEAFLRAFERLDQLGDDASFGAWIVTVTRNMAKDLLRSRARRPQALPLEAEPTTGAAPDRELPDRVLACIHTLPEAYREPLVLRLVEGLDGPSIADRLGMTSGSVRVNLHRGMSRLRPLLEKEGWP